MAKIKQINAREIFNARANPTIEVTVTLNDGAVGIASAPSGMSVSDYEAVDLRDHDQAHFNGQGIKKAIENIEKTIAPKLVDMDANKQQLIDRSMIELDGTQNKGRLGANAMLAVSMAVAKAAATSSVLPLFLYLRQYINSETASLKIPTPIFTMISGGKHAESQLDFQEFILIPASSKPYKDALEIGIMTYNTLRETLRTSGYGTLIGDEGGFSPKINTNYDALTILKQTLDQTPYRLGFDAFFGLDAAANNFYDNHEYKIKDKQTPQTAKDLNNYYADLMKQFDLLYLEDVLSQDDWEGWADAVSKLSGQSLIVGDDLIATNPYRLQMALDKKAITGVIIKPNQIGTVIEAMAVANVAHAAGLKVIVSHRVGETNDDFIADFGVAVSADYVKFGAPARGERIAKYNRLLQIEDQIEALHKT